jgi:hypothetical protein
MYAVLKSTIEAVCPFGGGVRLGKGPSELLMSELRPSLRRAAAGDDH